MVNFSEHVSFIWSIAEILRGNYKQSEYGKVVLPFTVLRRLDCVLEANKEAVLAKAASLPTGIDSAMAEVMLNIPRKAGESEEEHMAKVFETAASEDSKVEEEPTIEDLITDDVSYDI
jgi:type I restriction-modification system DNA methylase subunit